MRILIANVNTKIIRNKDNEEKKQKAVNRN